VKQIRSAVNNNKGFFAFWLLLFFVTASNARNVVSFFQDIHPTEFHHSSPGKYLLSTAVDESEIGIFQLKDSDIDDIEFIYYDNYSLHNPVILPGEEHDFAVAEEYYCAYKIPLYDLYCNWKFHLS